MEAMKKIFICVAAGVLLVSCHKKMIQEHNGTDFSSDVALTDSGYEYVTVLFTDEMTEIIEADLSDSGIQTRSSEFNAALEELGVKSMSRLFPHAGEYEKRTRAEGLHKWYVVEYDPSFVPTKAVDVFASIPGVEYTEPMPEPELNSLDIFNDPELYQQWHYYNDGTFGETCVAGADINVVPVWENYTTGSDKVIVALVDGGVQQNHPDLKDNLIGGKNYAQQDSPILPHGHGTHTAGTIAAVNNNGIGVCGIAGGDAARGVKGVKIWSAQILSDAGDAVTSRCATALKEGADYGAVISSNSWSIRSENKSVNSAIDYFIKYAGCDNEGNQRPDSPMKGGVVIFSSGNDGADIGYPASYGPAIAVGAVGCDNKVGSYSNYGDWVDICAPGGGGSGGLNVMSTVVGSTYIAWWGTSMSCPHVSGVAALLASYYGGPGFTNEMLEEKLIKGANYDAGTVEAKSGPLLDALGSFMYGNIAPEAVPALDVAVLKNTVSVSFKLTASESESGKAFGYTVVASKDREALKGLDYRNLPSSVLSVSGMTADKEVGADMSLSLEGLEHGTTYYVAVVGYDCYRTYSVLSPVYEVTTEGNKAPVISIEPDGIQQVWVNETLQFIYAVEDSDGDEFRIDFEPGSEAASCRCNLSGECVISIIGHSAEPGLYEAKITATDEYGAVSISILKYRIVN